MSKNECSDQILHSVTGHCGASVYAEDRGGYSRTPEYSRGEAKRSSLEGIILFIEDVSLENSKICNLYVCS